jgi:uncharacterized protein
MKYDVDFLKRFVSTDQPSSTRTRWIRPVVQPHGLVAHPRAGAAGPHGAHHLPDAVADLRDLLLWFRAQALGLPRAQQVLFEAVVNAAQIAFCHWWLAHFRYGPMECLRRGFTYRQVPPLHIAGMPAAPTQVA